MCTSDYALLANVIVAGEGATFQDVAHYAQDVTPGDGIFTTWSYRGGAGRAEAFLLDPEASGRRALRSNGEWSRRLCRTGRRSIERENWPNCT